MSRAAATLVSAAGVEAEQAPGGAMLQTAGLSARSVPSGVIAR